MDKILLIDGNSIMNRAYYGQRRGVHLSSSTGVPTGALHTFMMIFLRYKDRLQPSHIVVTFDRKEKTFRHEQFENYKSGRALMPEDLLVQFPLLKEMLDALSIARIEKIGFEADDLLGTLADHAEKQGLHVDILSGDHDTLQLITEKCHVVMPTNKSGQNDIVIYNMAAFKERYDVLPEQFVDVKALMGDSSDNIPGVPGIGEKTALNLIAKYGSLDGIYEHLDDLRERQRKLLDENKVQAYLSQKLSRIDCSVPLTDEQNEINNYRYTIPQAPEKAAEFLNELGMQQVAKYFDLNGLAAQKQPTLWVNDDAEIRKDAPDLASEGDKIWVQITPDGLTDYLKMQSTNGTERLFLAFSPTLRRAGTSKPSEELITPGAYLAILPRKINEEKSQPLPCTFRERDCLLALPDDKEGRQHIAQMLYNSGYEMISYRTKDFWRESLFTREQKATDIETMAYLLADYKDLHDFSALMQGVLTDANDCTATDNIVTREQFDYKMLCQDLKCLTSACLKQAGLIELAFAILKKRLNNEEKLIKLADDVDFPLSSCLGRMERRGFKIDQQVLDDLHQKFSKDAQSIGEQIYFYAGREFNINSPRQLSQILFEELKLPSGRKRQNAYSTDQDELQRLLGKHPIIEQIMNYRLLAKLDSTFIVGLKSYIDLKDGRIHSRFNQNLTNTGRLSSQDPNLQNIPVRDSIGREIRRAFVAAPGYTLLDADYSQIELRLLAHLSSDKAMIQAFRSGMDIHRRTAATIFSVAPEEVSPFERAAAKTINFSIIYGISPFSLSRDLKISVAEAKRYIAEYNAQYPNVAIFMEETIKKAKREGYVETYWGRRRYIPELKSRNYNLRQFGERAAMNTPVQGTAADIMRMAMLRCDLLLAKKKLDAALVSQVHDELIVEAREDQAEEAAAVLKESMQDVVQLEVPLIAEVSSGHSWFEAKA